MSNIKSRYNFRTKANFELLRYCAGTFKKGWLCMGQHQQWRFSVGKPKWKGLLWELGHKMDYLDYSVKLPKRRWQFAQHSLIRVTGKGLAWFDECPDFVINSEGEYYD